MSRGRAWHRGWRGLAWADAVCWRGGFSLLFGLGLGLGAALGSVCVFACCFPPVVGGCELDSGFGFGPGLGAAVTAHVGALGGGREGLRG